MNYREDRSHGGYTFYDQEGIPYMVRCHHCKAENYASSVRGGRCAWCGYQQPYYPPLSLETK